MKLARTRVEVRIRWARFGDRPDHAAVGHLSWVLGHCAFKARLPERSAGKGMGGLSARAAAEEGCKTGPRLEHAR